MWNLLTRLSLLCIWCVLQILVKNWRTIFLKKFWPWNCTIPSFLTSRNWLRCTFSFFWCVLELWKSSYHHLDVLHFLFLLFDIKFSDSLLFQSINIIVAHYLYYFNLTRLIFFYLICIFYIWLMFIFINNWLFIILIERSNTLKK